MANLGVDSRTALGFVDEEGSKSENSSATPEPKPGASPGPSGLSRRSRDRITPAAAEDRVDHWRFFTTGDFSSYSQDPLANLPAFDSDTTTGSVGLERTLSNHLGLGVAFSYLNSNLESPVGDLEMEGWTASAYATYYRNGFYADFLAAYGQFDWETRRNTGLFTVAQGETCSSGYNLDLNLGYNFEFERFNTGPTFALRYAASATDSFREKNRADDANLIFGSSEFDSLTSLLGWQATFHRPVRNALLTTQFRVGWGHEFLNSEQVLNVGLDNSPYSRYGALSGGRFGSYQTTTNSGRPGADFLSVGAGVELAMGDRVSIGLDYAGQLFRDGAEEHLITLRAGIRF